MTESWFRNNAWEESAACDRRAAQRVGRLLAVIPLLSRDPQAADFLKPAPAACTILNGDDEFPGRFECPVPPGDE